MSPLLVIAACAVAVALTAWNASVIKRFKRDYTYRGQFPGQRYQCVIRFANFESGMEAAVGADTSALYLLTHPLRKRRWGSHRCSMKYFGADLQIPRTDLDWREKRILLQDCVWFEIPAKKIYFYVPRDVGDKLLADAERKILAHV